MTNRELQKIRDDVMNIIEKSKATFFVSKGDKMPDDTDEIAYEMKSEISNSIGLYFYELLKK